MEDVFATTNTDITGQQAALSADEVALKKRHEEESARLMQQSLSHADQMVNAQKSQVAAESAPLPTRTDMVMPTAPTAKELFDPKSYQTFAFGLLGMALIGGSRGSDAWYATNAALTGAMKGFHEGQKEKADEAWKDYESKYKSAIEQQKLYDKRYEDTMSDRNKTIAQKLSEVKLIAAEQGRDDVRMAAESGSFDRALAQIRAGKMSTVKVEEAEGAVKMRKQQAEAIHALNAAGGGLLNEDGQRLVRQTMLGGNNDYAKMMMSRYGAKTAAPLLNALGKDLREAGVDPRDLTMEKLTLAADKVNLAQAGNRVAAVERLARSVQSIEQETLRLVAKMNSSQIPAANQTVNYFREKFGSAGLAEMDKLMTALATQYQEAISMPGSNAQMHSTTLETALKNFNRDMPLSAFVGSLKGINYEMNATRQSLHQQVEDIKNDMRGQGPTLPVPGAAAAPAHPQDSAALAWAKAHPGDKRAADILKANGQ
jgi:hypothetical protein